MNIAITGSIGSGKSQVATLLAKLARAEHKDTDDTCRRLLEHGQQGYRQVVAKWGQRFLDDQGDIDRARLRTEVFNDREIRKQLEAILHPLVRKDIQVLFTHCAQTDKMLVVEIPLLFETGWHKDFDFCVTVIATPEAVVERVVARDGVSAEQVQKVLSAQMNVAEKAKQSDWVIDNSATLAEMRSQVVALYENLKEKQQGE